MPKPYAILTFISVLVLPASALPVSVAKAKRVERELTSTKTEQPRTARQVHRKDDVGRRAPKKKAPCLSPQVHVVRKRGDELEHRDLNLTYCDGRAHPGALDSISVLARPRDVERPFMPEIRSYQRRPLEKGPARARRKPGYLSERVLRVHPGLVERLQAVAKRYPGKSIEIISGHRPDARDTSRHHHGRALDIRVAGVSREALRDFLRTVEDTGVGYYPNGYFVHMDVRDTKGYWVDRSGPGEPADYGTWPPREHEIERARKQVLANALAQLQGLAEPVDLDAPKARSVRDEERLVRDTPGSEKARVVRGEERAVRDGPGSDERGLGELPHEDAEMTAEEVARIRAEALQALEGL